MATSTRGLTDEGDLQRLMDEIEQKVVDSRHHPELAADLYHELEKPGSHVIYDPTETSVYGDKYDAMDHYRGVKAILREPSPPPAAGDSSVTDENDADTPHA